MDVTRRKEALSYTEKGLREGPFHIGAGVLYGPRRAYACLDCGRADLRGFAGG